MERQRQGDVGWSESFFKVRTGAPIVTWELRMNQKDQLRHMEKSLQEHARELLLTLFSLERVSCCVYLQGIHITNV